MDERHDSPLAEVNDEIDRPAITPTKTAGNKGKEKEDVPKTPTTARASVQKSTPLHQTGTASQAISDAYVSLTLPHLTPVVEMDVKRNEKVDFRTFLKFSLEQACIGDAPPDIVQRCLQAVLPICNAPETKVFLIEYCKQTSEVKRYAPKINAFNHILEALETVQPAGCEFQQPTDIMFHRNDPKLMNAKHNGMGTIRKPDVVLASKQAMLKSQNGRRLTPTRAPRKPFDWPRIQLTEEHKRCKKVIDFPPPFYSTHLSQYIPVVSDIRKPLKTRPITDPGEFPPSEGDGDEEGAGEDEEPKEEEGPDEDEEPENDEVAEEDEESGEEGEPGEGEEVVGDAEDAEDGDDFAPVQEAPRRSSRMPDIGGSLTEPSPSGIKRPRSGVARASSKKIKLETGSETVQSEKSYTTPSPIVQNALYAAEMLNRGVYALHAHSFLIVDDVAWIWYFDRQSAIQTTGINFIQDLPYLVALLFAFQRFNPQNWGIEPSLQGSNSPSAPFELTFPEEGSSSIKISVDPSDKIYDNFALNGRATRVLAASTRSERVLAGVKHKLIAKIYWPEESRINEAEAIKLAHERLEGTGLQQHLPTVVCWRDFEYTTGTIRKALGIKDKKTKSRVLRVLVAIYLKQLGSLRNEKKFFVGWRGCFKCHHALWTKGIEHGDISLWNLMWDPSRQVGVLNDFDLVHIRGRPSGGGRRTGTIAFMALDLLSVDAITDRHERLYRHDVESLIWVLIWICLFLQFVDDVPVGMTPVRMRAQMNHLQTWKNPILSSMARTNILQNFDSDFKPSTRFQTLWQLAEDLILWMINENAARKNHKVQMSRGRAGPFVEPAPEIVHQGIVGLVELFESSAKASFGLLEECESSDEGSA